MLFRSEDAGIHSGDSACVLPPVRIPAEYQDVMRQHTVALAKALGVVGLINVQYAIRDGEVYVLEVNPRASRTIPFVSKAIGVPLASIAARVMCGETLAQVGFTDEIVPPFLSVKEAVFPFRKFREFDPVLGPEMRSTGEVMGIAESFGIAFAKAQLAAENALPRSGALLVTVNDRDKATVAPIVKRFHAMGFRIFATSGTAAYLEGRGVPTEKVFKVHEGRPHALDLIEIARSCCSSTRRWANTHTRTTIRSARRRSRTASRIRRQCRLPARRAMRSRRLPRRSPACVHCRTGMRCCPPDVPCIRPDVICRDSSTR